MLWPTLLAVVATVYLIVRVVLTVRATGRQHERIQEFIDKVSNSARRQVMIEATIVEADAVVKGQTASSSYKPAILDNGVRVMVPPHITSGTRIVVNVYDREYVRRAD